MTQRRWFLSLCLFVAQSLFLWMYLSTHYVELMAARDRLQWEATSRYTAEWRHGLVGIWPVYVPGFFVCAIVTWFWSMGRSLRRVAVELLMISSAALTLALMLTPWGAGLVLRDISRDLGMTIRGPVPSPTAVGTLVALYSVLAWNASVISCQRALWWRSFWPLGVPVVLDAILYLVRPYTFDDLVSTWYVRTVTGDVRATACLAAVPLFAVLLGWSQLRWERTEAG